MIKRILIAVSCLLILSAAALFLFRDAVFQRGNPLPYVGKMFALNDNNPHARVFDDRDIYLTQKNNYDAMIRYIESAYDVTFTEQMGSAHFFESGDKSIIASTEVYWSNYMVWELEIL